MAIGAVRNGMSEDMHAKTLNQFFQKESAQENHFLGSALPIQRVVLDCWSSCDLKCTQLALM